MITDSSELYILILVTVILTFIEVFRVCDGMDTYIEWVLVYKSQRKEQSAGLASGAQQGPDCKQGSRGGIAAHTHPSAGQGWQYLAMESTAEALPAPQQCAHHSSPLLISFQVSWVLGDRNSNWTCHLSKQCV